NNGLIVTWIWLLANSPLAVRLSRTRKFSQQLEWCTIKASGVALWPSMAVGINGVLGIVIGVVPWPYANTNHLLSSAQYVVRGHQTTASWTPGSHRALL